MLALSPTKDPDALRTTLRESAYRTYTHPDWLLFSRQNTERANKEVAIADNVSNIIDLLRCIILRLREVRSWAAIFRSC